MNYVAYTQNEDNSINILAGSDNAAVFQAILPKSAVYEIHAGETFVAGGKTWLSQDDPGYIAAKAADEKAQALSELDAQYDADKAEIMSYYTQALFAGDEDEQEELRAEMEEIDAAYEEARAELKGE